MSITRPKDFEVVELEAGASVEIRARPQHVVQLKPIKLFVLPEGSIENKTSYVLLMEHSLGGVFVAQLTEKMLKEAWETRTKSKRGGHSAEGL